jgi:hypothetical protein
MKVLTKTQILSYVRRLQDVGILKETAPVHTIAKHFAGASLNEIFAEAVIGIPYIPQPKAIITTHVWETVETVTGVTDNQTMTQRVIMPELAAYNIRPHLINRQMFS